MQHSIATLFQSIALYPNYTYTRTYIHGMTYIHTYIHTYRESTGDLRAVDHDRVSGVEGGVEFLQLAQEGDEGEFRGGHTHLWPG